MTSPASPTYLVSPGRPSTCVRAPCLKRHTSAPLAELRLATIGAAGALAGASISTSRDASHSPGSVLSSFAAPRSLSAALPKRHVHFDSAPPEAYFTHSSDRYDRRPIECTQGGSAFDLSLPPRCTTYILGEVDDAEETEENPIGGDREELYKEDSTGWACLKNGTLITSIDSLVSLTDSDEVSVSKDWHNIPSPDTENASHCPDAQVSLPVHGFRSFGGLCNRPNSMTATNEEREPSSSDAADSNTSKSPDATPMPSPSIKRTLESNGHFFPLREGLPLRVNEDDSNDPASRLCPSPLPPVIPLPVADNSIKLSISQLDTSQEGRIFSLPIVEGERLAGTLVWHGPIEKTISIERTSTWQDSLTEHASGSRDPSADELASIATTLSLTGIAHVRQEGGDLMSESAQPDVDMGSGLSSSPMSSRCSSIDPWSGISSDGTNSPGNDCWNSSSCTSPELGPVDGALLTGGFFKDAERQLDAWLHSPLRSRPIQVRGTDPKRVDFDGRQEPYRAFYNGDPDGAGESTMSCSIETIVLEHHHPLTRGRSATRDMFLLETPEAHSSQDDLTLEEVHLSPKVVKVPRSKARSDSKEQDRAKSRCGSKCRARSTGKDATLESDGITSVREGILARCEKHDRCERSRERKAGKEKDKDREAASASIKRMRKEREMEREREREWERNEARCRERRLFGDEFGPDCSILDGF
ncbi:hypothetical protein IE53DRAFT_20724 [Violaceomyces palustris]|uniref:Uncharacterized protein n=1 Tax=Violaceomyces palustris TaxID=1673888 RepID=A0ACD0P1X7_9BASI|nr:hypothetical protein IE53DRAFT_20724 [Violaceomyces palustris]